MMTASDDGAITKAPTAIWCGTCGIPYATDTVYCANCGAELAPLDIFADALTTPLTAPADQSALLAPPKAANDELSPPLNMALESASPLAVRLQGRQAAPVNDLAVPVPPLASRTLDEVFPSPPRGLIDRVRQRSHAMSEDEIDAAAAAIIAQARHAETDADSPRDALALLADFAPDPVVKAALEQRRNRDRVWLIGGIICCVLLILFALVVSRSMSVGLLRQ
jgi:hypothetical protein